MLAAGIPVGSVFRCGDWFRIRVQLNAASLTSMRIWTWFR